MPTPLLSTDAHRIGERQLAVSGSSPIAVTTASPQRHPNGTCGRNYPLRAVAQTRLGQHCHKSIRRRPVKKGTQRVATRAAQGVTVNDPFMEVGAMSQW